MEKLEWVHFGGENYLKISHVDNMRPFFMSLVSYSNHWMFITSNGGLTAGRKNSEFALFPYYTDDKLVNSIHNTGPLTIIRMEKDGNTVLWEPFSPCFSKKFDVQRNLYKNIYGNKIIFEEVNHTLSLSFRYQWCSSNAYGFVRKSTITNNGQEVVSLSILDGLQNILPASVPSDLQMRSSNLVDAYKRSELHAQSGMGLYSLSSIIMDRAEPGEALKSNIAWSFGLEHEDYLLSDDQILSFRETGQVKTEIDIKGEKGAYLIKSDLELSERNHKEWFIIANVNQDHSDVYRLISEITAKDLNIIDKVNADIDEGKRELIKLCAHADALQLTANRLEDVRHYSNVLFNIMRGGIFDDQYTIEKIDFLKYLDGANNILSLKLTDRLKSLSDAFDIFHLQHVATEVDDQDFTRLAIEYLPLKFSRRHGDPSRPWNKFSINTISEIDGSKILDYEGNWRDIFQNWEALARSYPAFLDGMIYKFLNATTFEGYNPYRVTKEGFDWEIVDPDDAWSYIGYWGDHQIIYLLKFLEQIEAHYPGKLLEYFDKDVFVYAQVPYLIKTFEEILQDPKNTIVFDYEQDLEIRKKRNSVGSDGALHRTQGGDIIHVNFIEKILATVLCKISNFVPDAGIWMNTQRPEWNDANNALVGNGVSVVTLCYLYRFIEFFDRLLSRTDLEQVQISEEMVEFYHGIRETLESHSHLLESGVDNNRRMKILKELGGFASEYRQRIYENGFWGAKRSISVKGLRRFTEISKIFFRHSIIANKREDNLYHAYNLITLEQDGININRLSEMLEGQVAVLSSGHLESVEALDLLDSLRQSSLYRKDQDSYLLYPNKQLNGFLHKNNIEKSKVEGIGLITTLVEEGDRRLVIKDINGNYHFNGSIINSGVLQEVLDRLAVSKFSNLVKECGDQVHELFEEEFVHKEFTGRSGTFFGYEGLGSIYWHMVSKLGLAVQECLIMAESTGSDKETLSRIIEHYYHIKRGIGVNKSPSVYGAFSTDPYSHTPQGRGAQQPGMTGQVKEDILCKWNELGVLVDNGKLSFDPVMLKNATFSKGSGTFNYIDVQNKSQSIELEGTFIAFTICQVPVCYYPDDVSSIKIHYRSVEVSIENSASMSREQSLELFKRSGKILRIDVRIPREKLG